MPKLFLHLFRTPGYIQNVCAKTTYGFSMQNRIISLGILFFIGTTSILFFITALAIWAFTVLLDRRLIILHCFTSFWASLYLWIVPAWSISIKGRDKIKKGTTYIIVSNHQSQLDILAAFKLFFHFKWVSKAEIFKVPLNTYSSHRH